MLAKMREAGNKTPVLMLTSEAKRSIVGEVMKLGIEDYILKPFKPEELKAKVSKVLKDLGGAGATPVSAAAAISPERRSRSGAGEPAAEPGARLLRRRLPGRRHGQRPQAPARPRCREHLDGCVLVRRRTRSTASASASTAWSSSTTRSPT